MSLFTKIKSSSFITVVLIFTGLILLNIFAQFIKSHIDLTQEKRFTLTEPTKKELKNVQDAVFVRVLLDGHFPAGFKRLQTAVRDILIEYHGINPLVEFKFEDPDIAGDAVEKKKKFEEFAQQGLVPMRLRLIDNDQKTEQYIFPYAIVNYRNNQTVVRLLENEVPGQNPEIAINNSVSLLEYKLSNAIQKLLSNQRPNIVFTEGHDELSPEETYDLESGLRQFYNTGRFNLDSVTQIPFKDTLNRVDILIVAKPKKPFSEKQKFLLDQYIMQGGKVLWLIDVLNADLQSMQQTGRIIPTDYNLNLNDQFFKYGFRLNPNIIADMECARIPLKVGQVGGTPQMDLFQWFYYPIVSPKSAHPIVKSLDRVWLQFPSNIDTIKTKTEVRKTVLLTSSAHSRLQYVPSEINFEMLRYTPEPEKFNNGLQPVAVILEGIFPSLFENRVSEQQLQVLQKLGQTYRTQSVSTKMLVVSDGDVAKNEVDAQKNTSLPLGYNKVERYKFANKDFLLNAIEYMLDDNGIIAARSKEVRLRLLDAPKAKAEINYWRFINIGVPLIALVFAGIFFTWKRKEKFAVNK